MANNGLYFLPGFRQTLPTMGWSQMAAVASPWVPVNPIEPQPVNPALVVQPPKDPNLTIDLVSPNLADSVSKIP